MPLDHCSRRPLCDWIVSKSRMIDRLRFRKYVTSDTWPWLKSSVLASFQKFGNLSDRIFKDCWAEFKLWVDRGRMRLLSKGTHRSKISKHDSYAVGTPVSFVRVVGSCSTAEYIGNIEWDHSISPFRQKGVGFEGERLFLENGGG